MKTVYPVETSAENERRFTLGLTEDVAATLVKHGYPEPTSDDLVQLQLKLLEFIFKARSVTSG